MLLVNRITLNQLINYRKDVVNCLNVNIKNTYIKEILIFLETVDNNLPKNNKIKYIIKNNYSDIDIIRYSKKISYQKYIIFSKSLHIFGNELMKFNLNNYIKDTNFIFFNRDYNIENEIIDNKLINKLENINNKSLGKLDVIIVSVNYNDYLSITLKENKKLFKNITVITSKNDFKCQKICDELEVSFIICDDILKDGVLNKSIGINKGINSLKNPDWILILDADIIVNNNIDIYNLDYKTLYTNSRWIIEDINDYNNYKVGNKLLSEFIFEKNKGIGFFQLFNYKFKKRYPDSDGGRYSESTWSDLVFKKKFNQINSLNLEVIHLGRPYQKWNKVEINEDYIKDIDKFDKNINLIVSLTSYGIRVNTVHITIESILNQSINNFKVVLWLSEDEFINKNNDIPIELSRLIGDRFSIMWTKDIKSYKKIIPSILKYSDSIIVTADDDIIYDRDWLEILYKTHIKYPDRIVAHRVHRISIDINENILPYKSWKMRIKKHSSSFLNFFTGAGGVLYPPNSLYKDVINEDLFLKLCPNADDIWLWAMALLNNTQILIPKECKKDLNYIEGTQNIEDKNKPLHIENVKQGGNDIKLDNVLRYYPELKKIIINYSKKEDNKNIVFICDNNYSLFTSVAISSLIESKFSDTIYKIHIILDGYVNTNIFKSIESKYKIKLNYIETNELDLKGLHNYKNGGYCVASESALLKFKIPNLLKEEDKVLYLDGDIIVKKDLSDIFDVDLENKPIGAILDSGMLYNKGIKKYKQRYFNSGVMLLDLKKFREYNYSEKLIREKLNLKDNSLMDQNVFNIVFRENFLELDIKFNFLFTNLIRSRERYSINDLNSLYNSKYNDLNDILDNTYIVHFASKDKPWKFTNVPFSEEWFSIYSNIYSNQTIERSINNEWVKLNYK